MRLFFITILLLAFTVTAQTRAAEKNARRANVTVRHVVCFKFKAGTTEDQVRSMEGEFSKLKDKIDGITRFEHGKNNSPEALNKGFTHCYIATFKDAAARDAYLPHPAHKEFVEKHLRPILDDVFVIDFGGN